MKPQLIRRLIDGRVGKTLTIAFTSGEVVNAKIISANQDLEEDADFYYIDLDKAPDVGFIEDGPGRVKTHVYSAIYAEVKEVEIPSPSA